MENIEINAGDADDTFEIDSFKTGAVLSINGGGGDDVVTITPSSKDIAANVTNIGGFSFDGGDGTDSLEMFNDASTVAWTYTINTTSFTASKSGAHLTVTDQNVEDYYASGGSVADAFVIQNPGVVTITGGAGLDTVTQTGGEVVLQGAQDLASVSDSGGVLVLSAGVEESRVHQIHRA